MPIIRADWILILKSWLYKFTLLQRIINDFNIKYMKKLCIQFVHLISILSNFKLVERISAIILFMSNSINIFLNNYFYGIFIISSIDQFENVQWTVSLVVGCIEDFLIRCIPSHFNYHIYCSSSHKPHVEVRLHFMLLHKYVFLVISIIIFIKVGLHFFVLHKYAFLVTFEIVGCLLQICTFVNDVFSTSLLPSLSRLSNGFSISMILL